MGRTYKCTKCGKDHEKPVGEHCQQAEDVIITDNANMADKGAGATTVTEVADSGENTGTDMAAVLSSLKAISQRLDAIEASHSTPAAGTTVSQAPVPQAPLTDAGKTFDELLQINDSEVNKQHNGGTASGAASGAASSAASSPLHTGFDKNSYDPRTVLTVRAKRVKAVHITQFLHEETKTRRARSQRRNVALECGEGLQERLVIQADDQHPYAGIQIAEWGAANCRLMHHLLETGQLKQCDTEYYLAYTTKIFDMVDKFEWSSVLDYDFRYRELQAEHCFNWGTVHPHLELQVLVPRSRPTADNKMRARQKPTVKVDDCKLYLAHGYCRFGENCRYRHPVSNSDTDTVEKNVKN